MKPTEVIVQVAIVPLLIAVFVAVVLRTLVFAFGLPFDYTLRLGSLVITVAVWGYSLWLSMIAVGRAYLLAEALKAKETK